MARQVRRVAGLGSGGGGAPGGPRPYKSDDEFFRKLKEISEQQELIDQGNETDTFLGKALELLGKPVSATTSALREGYAAAQQVMPDWTDPRNPDGFVGGLVDNPLVTALAQAVDPSRSVLPTALSMYGEARESSGEADEYRAKAASGELDQGGPSWDRFKQNFDSNYGFGSFLHDTNASTGNEWADRGLGLAGDIALDPLTYLAPQAHLRKLGKDGVARIAFDVGENAIGQKALKGVSTLSNDELARLSEKALSAGLVDKPLKGGVYLGFGDAQVRLMGRNPLTSGVASTFRHAEEALRRGPLGEVGRRYLPGMDETRLALTQIARRGDPAQAGDAFKAIGALRQGSGAKAATMSRAAQELHHGRKELAGQVDGDQVRRILEGEDPAQVLGEGFDPELVGRLREINESFPAIAESEAGTQFIPRREDHAYAALTDDFREVLGSSSSGRPAPSVYDRAGFEQAATLIPGGSFRGHPLLAATEAQAERVYQEALEAAAAQGLDPSTVQRVAVHPEGLTPRAQAEQIMQRLDGPDAARVFDDDYWKGVERAIPNLAERAGAKRTEEALKAAGVAIDATDPDPAVLTKMAASLDPSFAANERANRMLGEAKTLQATDPDLADALRQQAADELAEARMAARGEPLAVDAAATRLKEADPRELLELTMAGMGRLSSDTLAPEWLVDVLKDASKLSTPQDMNVALKSFDYVTKLFKTYALFTPGYHFRNLYGGWFNNWLADVSNDSYRKWFRADKAYRTVLNKTQDEAAALAAVRTKLGDDVAAAYQQVLESRMLGAANIFSDVAVDQTKKFGVTSNLATRGSQRVGREVERELRGTHMLDKILKGANPDDAMASTIKYQFDYDDLSQFERNIMKRIVPFYTWTRKNLPLQIEMLLTEPKKANRVGLVLENFKGEDDGTPVPSWFGKEFAQKLPFGDNLHLLPDIPMADLNLLDGVASPGELGRDVGGMVNPILKLPVELTMDKQVFTGRDFMSGYQPVPAAFNALGLGKAMEAIGLAERAADGSLMAREEHLYAVEQVMPLFGRARRLAPSEPQYTDRYASTLMSMLFGLGVRTNTEADQEREIKRRKRVADERRRDRKSLGYEDE